jgi:hypothetical protein
MAYNMGIGKIAERNVTFKRKFRWVFRVENINGNPAQFIPEHYVKNTARPNIDFGETTVHHLHGQMTMPNKATFQDITLVYFDIVDNDDSMLQLYNWIGGVYDFLSPTGTALNPRMSANATGPGGYTATGKLGMLDGCGQGLEQFTLFMCWPKTVDFGELNYETQDASEVTLTLKYQFAKRVNLAGNQSTFTCAAGRGTSGGAGFTYNFPWSPAGSIGGIT